MHENHQVDLFSLAPFAFSTAGEEPLLGLAGFLGEGLNFCHAGLSGVDVERELSEKCVGVNRWPEGYVPYTVDTDGVRAHVRDEAIAAAAQLRARGYLQRHAGSEDQIIKSRMVFVEYLLLVFTYNYRTSYIHTHELLQHLNSYGYQHFTEHRFRSLAVAPETALKGTGPSPLASLRTVHLATGLIMAMKVAAPAQVVLKAAPVQPVRRKIAALALRPVLTQTQPKGKKNTSPFLTTTGPGSGKTPASLLRRRRRRM